MLQVYADGVLAADQRLQDFGLLGIKTTHGLNKSGTMELVLPPRHPSYNSFTSHKTIVTLVEDGELRFRGRALYPEDDYHGRRTIMCEGERGFLRDAVMRPYLYTTDPASIFADLIGVYNSQVEAAKQFVVGEISVVDPNEYVRLESESAEQVADTLDKLVERCGGFVTFSTDASGARCINWLAELNYQSGQVIEFGSNLLDFSRSGANTALATAVLPYGAKNEETGERVSIASVNGGLDWIQDDDAVALRGFICQPVTWDDVTEPANLLTKAQQYLAQSKLFVTTLSLTAVDLSRMDKSLDGFHVGDRVRVLSKPHGVDEYFTLTERTIDHLDPAGGSISLGKDKASLTGADVAGDRQSASALQQTAQVIRADYQAGIAAAVQQAQTTLMSLIEQTSTSIMLQVSEQYATGDQVTNLVQSQITQLSDSVEFTFTQLRTELETADGETRTRVSELEKYVRIENGDLILGESGSEITLHLENDRISFLAGGAEVAYISDQKLYITDGHFLNSVRIGKIAFVPRENGNTSVIRVSD